MTRVELVHSKIGQNVAVHEKEILREVRYEAQRSYGTERLILQRVINSHLPSLSAAEKSFDEIGLMVDRHGDVIEALVGELPDDYFQDGVIADGHQRFGQYDRVGAQSGAFAAGQDDRPSRHYRDRPCSGLDYADLETIPPFVSSRL